jgi:hypothetical protein
MEMKILRQTGSRNRKYIQFILGNISGGWLGFQRLVEGIAKGEDGMLVKDGEGVFRRKLYVWRSIRVVYVGGVQEI